MNNILLTGANGFLGHTIQHGFTDSHVITLGRRNENIICDLSSKVPKLSKFDLVIHSAGKAHSVPKTEAEKQDFFNVNVNGTRNLLKGLERSPALPRAFVFISSVSVYGSPHGELINEEAALNATDPYGHSKIQAERIIQEWCAEHSVICTILRLPLLVGQNPPGNLGAMIKGIKKGYYFNIAGGRARKSMVMAIDVANAIPTVAEIGGVYNLTDGYHPSFAELSELIAKQVGKSKPFNIPRWLALAMGRTGDLLGPKAPINSDKLRKITSNLTFDDSKARQAFNWNPSHVLETISIK